MFCTEGSTDGKPAITFILSAEATIQHALDGLRGLPLKYGWVNNGWRGAYLGLIRSMAAELSMHAQLADYRAQQARAARDRAVDEMHGLYYTTKVAFQIAKIVDMDEEPDIIPQMQDETGIAFTVFGDDVDVTIYLRVDGRIFLTVRNTVSGIEPVTVEISDEGLTPIATILVSNVYFSPLTRRSTPAHLRWMWDCHSDSHIASSLDELGIDAASYYVLAVPVPGGLYVELTPRG